MYYEINGTFRRLPDAVSASQCHFVAVLSSTEWDLWKKDLGFPTSAGLEGTCFHNCKTEIYAHYIFGVIPVPDHEHLLGAPTNFLYYLNQHGLVWIDDGKQTERIVEKILQRYQNQKISLEFFLYAFLSELLQPDMELLESMEKRLLSMEEMALHHQRPDFIPRLLHIRRELIVLRCYYEQLQDMFRELGNNAKNYFSSQQLHHLQLISDRSGQLLNMTQQAVEYSQTLRDVYQACLDHRQNKNMRLLTILTSVFFPLTLITGWYGMNFEHMPELQSEYGYPTVIVISLTVIVIELFILLRYRK